MTEANSQLRSIIQRAYVFDESLFTHLAEIAPKASVRRTVSPVGRFLAKVSYMPSGCIEWTGCRTPEGYGQFSWLKTVFYAHRWVKEALDGKILDGLVIDHLCRNPSCVNPNHLEVVTMAENTRRGVLYSLRRIKSLNRTVCDRGHSLPSAIVAADRGCLECQKIAARNWKRANRARVNALQNARRAACRELANASI